MVVGEPSLMGGEFGEEDERVITRLENNQYEQSAVPTNGLEENVDFTASLSGQQQSNSGVSQSTPNQQQPIQSPINQSQINPSPNNQMNNCGIQIPQQNHGQWSGGQTHSNQVSQQTGVNGNNNSNNGGIISNPPPSIGGNSIEDKKQSPISQ